MNHNLALCIAYPLGFMVLGCASAGDMPPISPAPLIPVTSAAHRTSVAPRLEVLPAFAADAAPEAELAAAEPVRIRQLPAVQVMAPPPALVPLANSEPNRTSSFSSYAFGESAPVLTCTVLRACVIELQLGESLVDDPIAGDQSRWIITTARAGKDAVSTLVVVKPKACDVTTNLVLSTDRRIYDVDLDSPACSPHETNPKRAYTRRIKFTYPNDPVATDSGLADRDSAATETSTIPETSSAERDSTPPQNTNYRIVGRLRGPFGIFGRRGPAFPWRPTRIADDGRHVYISFPVVADRYPSPVLYALEEDGSRTMVNYSVHDSQMVTDRVFQRGVLVMPDGNGERTLVFENRAWNVSLPSGERR